MLAHVRPFFFSRGSSNTPATSQGTVGTSYALRLPFPCGTLRRYLSPCTTPASLLPRRKSSLYIFDTVCADTHSPLTYTPYIHRPHRAFDSARRFPAAAPRRPRNISCQYPQKKPRLDQKSCNQYRVFPLIRQAVPNLHATFTPSGISYASIPRACQCSYRHPRLRLQPGANNTASQDFIRFVAIRKIV